MFVTQFKPALLLSKETLKLTPLSWIENPCTISYDVGFCFPFYTVEASLVAKWPKHYLTFRQSQTTWRTPPNTQEGSLGMQGLRKDPDIGLLVEGRELWTILFLLQKATSWRERGLSDPGLWDDLGQHSGHFGPPRLPWNGDGHRLS